MFVLLIQSGIQAQFVQNVELKWSKPEFLKIGNEEKLVLKVEGAGLNDNLMPYYSLKSDLYSQFSKVEIIEVFFSPIDEEWYDAIYHEISLENQIQPQIQHLHYRKQPYSVLSFIPLRRNENGKIEKLDKISFKIDVSKVSVSNVSQSKSASNSVLANGVWHKLGVTQNGVYKLTYEYLLTNNILSGSVSSESIKLFGNGGGMLPEENSAFRYDDLQENSIRMYDGGDGVFGAGDYLLFYGKGPHSWNYSSLDSQYYHSHNIYSDSAYYFITIQGTGGKRLSLRPSDVSSPTYVSNTSDEYFYREDELYNVINSGRQFLGDYFNFTNEYSYNHTLQNVQTSSPLYIRANVAARCVSCPTNMIIRANGNSVLTLTPNGVSPSYTAAYCSSSIQDANFYITGNTINLDIQKTAGDEAWLDYYEISYRKNNVFSGNSFEFRDKNAINAGVTEFVLSSTNSNVEIWDITDPLNVVLQSSTFSGGETRFRVSTDTLMQFVALDGSNFPTPSYHGTIANQNLHALTEPSHGTDFIIVTYPGFIEAANELANFHLIHDGLITDVVTTDQIYNEFSSGSQDVTAIRDFVRMYYDKAPPGDMPRYLLLFGDGSFDYKTYLNRVKDDAGQTVPNTNYVPAFETFNSFDRSGNSYASDDFFGLLDSSEGEFGKIVLNSSSNLDIGIGRLPVETLEEAWDAVNKIKHYASSKECLRDWRNVVTLVADDMEDGWESSFFSGSQLIANQMQTKYPVWNIEKIYLDAYQQINNAGQRYPEANEALNNRINRGSLIVNYIGHGGELGWTGERLHGIDDILSWENFNNLPAFTTATCTYARFDNPAFRSAGELLVLEPEKGGIGLFGTVRAISIVPDFNRKFYDAAFTRLPDGEMPRMGDIIMLSKQPNPVNNYGEWNILLFGDPALRLAYPEFKVVTDSINGNWADTTTGAISDTLMASQLVTITGHIEDLDGSLMSSFNGTLYTTIFDKPAQLVTLANDPGAVSFSFEMLKNIIFKGKSTVENGYFKFSFIVPLDINYLIDEGKISYYAENEVIDAHGFYNKFSVGGSEDNCSGDGIGPEIDIFMNDSNFVDMGITDESPELLIHLNDVSGINTVGNGIGHDIVAIFDGDQTNLIRLNAYYEADLNSYQSGKVRFPLSGLTPGIHTVEVKVWDGCNNISSKTLNFVVTNSSIALINIYGYPNPFIHSTTITFEHNRADEILQLEFMISDLQGKIVKRQNIEHTPNGYRDISIQWDGTDDTGHKMAAGVYICRVNIKDSNEEEAIGVCKLVLIK